MKTAIYNGKLITPAEVLENKVLVLENDRIIDILAEDVIDLEIGRASCRERV